MPAEEQTSKPTEMKIGKSHLHTAIPCVGWFCMKHVVESLPGGDGGFNVDKTNYEYFHAYEVHSTALWHYDAAAVDVVRFIDCVAAGGQGLPD